MSKKTKTLLSTMNDLIKLEIPRNIRQALTHEGRKQELYLNQKVRSLSLLLPGVVVQVKPHVKNKEWTKRKLSEGAE